MKKNILIIDTESNNSISDPEVYDIGYIIIDGEDYNTVLEHRGFLVEGVPVPAKKHLFYAVDMAYSTATLPEIRDLIARDIATYNVGYIGGYNTAYDIRVLKNTYIGDLLPAEIPKFCVWEIACKTILCQQDYITYVTKNGYFTSDHTPKTTLEIVYNYIAEIPIPAPQRHKALPDSLWTAVILKDCIMSYDITLEKNCNINPFCWRTVKKLTQQKTQKQKQKNVQKEDRIIEEAILSVLEVATVDKRPMTASAIRNASDTLNQYSRQKISAVLLNMAKNKKITPIYCGSAERTIMTYMI